MPRRKRQLQAFDFVSKAETMLAPCRLREIQDGFIRSFLQGHLEISEVAVRGMDASPCSSAQALEHEAKWKSHFSFRVSKNPKDGIFRAPLKEPLIESEVPVV